MDRICLQPAACYGRETCLAMTATSVNKLHAMRRKAVQRLFEERLKASIRITVGSATCENAAGADAVYERFQKRLVEKGVKNVALTRVGCAGKCDMEPVVTLITKERIPIKYVKMTPERVDQVVESHLVKGVPVREFTMRHVAGLNTDATRIVSICGGSTCLKHGALDLEKVFVAEIHANGLDSRVAVTRSACQGFCERGPWRISIRMACDTRS